MNNTAWMVAGMFIGVVIAIMFYEAEYKAMRRDRDRYERLCNELAADYKAQSDELEQAYAEQ